MKTDSVDKYLLIKKYRKDAEEWNELPHGSSYKSSNFDISLPHCTLELQRMGQKVQGGQSYWDTQRPFNQAILEVIKDNWGFIYEESIKVMKKKELDALKECQCFSDELIELISNI